MTSSNSSIRWGRLVAESVAIVTSILLAFALDAAWESRTERIEEAAELDRLRSETRDNIDRFEGELTGYLSQLEYADSLLATLEEQSHDEGFVTVDDNLLLSLLFASIVEPDRAVLDALISSGRLSLLSNPQVRESIANLSARFADTRDQHERTRDHYMNRLLPYLSANAQITGLLRNRRIDVVEEQFERPGAFPWTLAEGQTSLPNTPELRNLVGQQVLFLSEAARASRNILSTLQEHLLLLDGAVG